VTPAIKFTEAPSSKAAPPAAPGAGVAGRCASRWPPYWAAPADSAAERRDRRLSDPEAEAQARRWE
jgi:hypothetical protein